MKEDQMYSELVRQVKELKEMIPVNLEAKTHVETLLRVLSVQFERTKEDAANAEQRFELGVTKLQHLVAINENLRKTAINGINQEIMKGLFGLHLDGNSEDIQEKEELPITYTEMVDLIDKLMEKLQSPYELIILEIPTKTQDTCWHKCLTTQEKDDLLFVGKCGECNCYHEFPKCDQCSTIRLTRGRCQACKHMKTIEEPYQGFCGNCCSTHELPTCIECKYYRLKPGRCTNCGAIGPDDVQWKTQCTEEDDDYDAVMKPILQRRFEKIGANRKKFKTYECCPLCDGAYHSIKGCISRKHAEHFRNLEKTKENHEVKEAVTSETEPMMEFNSLLKKLTQKNDKAAKPASGGEDDTKPVSRCEFTAEKLKTSICKILPDGAEFPDDLFTVEGCIWCGSKGHDIFSCLGYIKWLDEVLGIARSKELWDVKKQRRQEALQTARAYYDTRRPWELYIGRDDGEYITEQGVKILVKDRKIINMIPRHLQTTTTVYTDFPTPKEINRMTKLSTTVQPNGHLSLSEELTNQTVLFKEDLETLEVELKNSTAKQLKNLRQHYQYTMEKFYMALVDDRIAQLPKQFDRLHDFLSKTITNLHQRSMKSDLTIIKTFRDLFEARTPDSNLIWKRDICNQDPMYQFRGRWRQLADRLNSISDHAIKSNSVIPITGMKHAEDLRTMVELLIQVMQQTFLQMGVLQQDDLLDMGDFALFQETASRTIQMQAISSNQLCNFMQQIAYYQQCSIHDSPMDYMRHRKQLDIMIGILLQTTVKRWGMTGNCQCDYMDKLSCIHSHKYSIMRQHFPHRSHQAVVDLLDFLDTITTQTCDCHYHAQLPLHGPSKYLKEPIPTFEQMKQLHQDIAPEISPEELQKCYVDAIVSWIYARLFLYMTPYIDPTMLKRESTSGFFHSNCLELEFPQVERDYLEQQIYLQGQDVDYAERLEKLNQLAGLKKTYCRSTRNKEDKETNLLANLKLPRTAGNQTLIRKILEFMPKQFSIILSSCEQIIGTGQNCKLIQYDVTPNEDGWNFCSRRAI